MNKGVLALLVLIFSVAGLAAGQEVEQEECCPDRVTNIGIGAWFHQERICVSMRHWATEDRALELDFCAPPKAGRLNVFIKGFNRISDTCFLDLYMTGGVGIPVGGKIDWQRIEGSVGTEWCFPKLSQTTISLEVGASIHHYQAPSFQWLWESETFISGGIHFYF